MAAPKPRPWRLVKEIGIGTNVFKHHKYFRLKKEAEAHGKTMTEQGIKVAVIKRDVPLPYRPKRKK
jgi:hypothetical protein